MPVSLLCFVHNCQLVIVMQFRLRTLLIVLAVLPPLLAGAWFEWMAYRARQQESILMNVTPGITIAEEEGTLGLEQGKGSQGKGSPRQGKGSGFID